MTFLVRLGPLIIVARFEVGLSVDAVLHSFFIHGDHARFPLLVVARDPEPDVGDDAGVVTGNSFPHRLYQHPSFALVVEAVGKLGLVLHLSEEEVGGAHHMELAHLLFMDQFDGQVAELLAHHGGKLGPVRESVSRTAIEG